jgi:hypothetical protein
VKLLKQNEIRATGAATQIQLYVEYAGWSKFIVWGMQVGWVELILNPTLFYGRIIKARN